MPVYKIYRDNLLLFRVSSGGRTFLLRADGWQALAEWTEPRAPIADPDPPPGGIPPSLPAIASSFDKPANQDELKALLQGYADQQVLGQLDPRTDVTLDKTLLVQCGGGGNLWGVKGNGAKIRWAGNAMADMIVYQGTQGQPARSLLIEGLDFDGAGWDKIPAAACLKLSAPLGDNGPIYKFTLRDIFTKYATNGIVLEGGVYEGAGYNLHAESHCGDGVLMQHLPEIEGAKAPVVSNIFLYGLNSSRNLGAGLRSVHSVNVYGFSFILNGAGGIVAPEGIRLVDGGNGENTGEAVVVLGSNGWGSVIRNVEASSDGVTVCRRYDGSTNQWVDVGKPLRYAVDMRAAPGAIAADCTVAFYGQGTSPMQVLQTA